MNAITAATITPQEASKRRRLVYASCQGVLSEKDSMTMVQLCDSHFAQVETFTPFRFFKEAQTRFNLSAPLVKTLMQRFTESQKIAIEQLADPSSGMSAGAMTAMPGVPSVPSPSMPAPSGDVNAGKSAQQVVFESLVAKLFSYLRIPETPNVRNYLADVVASSKLAAPAKDLLTQSVQTGSLVSQQALKAPDMASVIDIMYSCYCELYGPVQADRIFSSIVSEVEMTVPHARQFSPREFL